jgi:hypothetical protein
MKARFLAVADRENTVRIYNLDSKGEGTCSTCSYYDYSILYFVTFFLSSA